AVDYYTGVYDEYEPDWRTRAPMNLYEFAAATQLEPAARLALLNEAIAKKPGRRSRAPFLASWLTIGEVTDQARAIYAPDPFQPAKPLPAYYAVGMTEAQWVQWKLTGDMRFLIDAYRRTSEWLHNYHWLITEGRPSH